VIEVERFCVIRLAHVSWSRLIAIIDSLVKLVLLEELLDVLLLEMRHALGLGDGGALLILHVHYKQYLYKI